MAFIGEGNTTPTSTATTDASYYQKYLEEQKRLAALALQQNLDKANEGQSGYDPNANNWWYQLTKKPAKQAHFNTPAWVTNTLGYLQQHQAPSGVSQAIGNTGYANWSTQSQFPAFAPMTATPGYMNPADAYAKRQQTYNQYLNLVNGYSGRYDDPIAENSFVGNRFYNDEIARRAYDPGINRYFTDPNISDYIVNFDNANFPPGGGGYNLPEYPEWNFGGGGGGGRRSSGGIGRSKQLASWYQAMTNWNINRPQSG